MNTNLTGVLIRRRDWETDRDEKQREDTGRRWPYPSQREMPQKKPILPTPRCQTSSLQNCEEINFCCLKKKKKINAKLSNKSRIPKKMRY